MEFKFNDGGRAKYFKGKNVADCVTRSIAIASCTDYKEVYNYIHKISGESPRNGVRKKYTRQAAEHFGGHWVACMEIGSGCKTHLVESELPKGRIVCSCSGHCVAVIDGVINDTYQPDRNGSRCVYGYWVFNS
ncbi:MAG: hypothetical protein MJ237_06145 [bacterium]|nr:hypothetical protein [bacterium]